MKTETSATRQGSQGKTTLEDPASSSTEAAKPPIFWMVLPIVLIALGIYLSS